jgi:hypothetical protein
LDLLRLERLRESNTVRVIDALAEALAVYEHARRGRGTERKSRP